MSDPSFNSTTYIDRVRRRPGERCSFHPECCDADDTTCPGCGNEAEGAIAFRGKDETAPRQRIGYCTEHAAYVAEAIIQKMQQQSATQN
jgi:hypothetical protein